jgi:hypothetical protein
MDPLVSTGLAFLDPDPDSYRIGNVDPEPDPGSRRLIKIKNKPDFQHID